MKKLLANKIANLILYSLFAVAGIVTIIFAIINLAGQSKAGTDPTLPLRIILGVMLILASLSLIFVGITTPEKPAMVHSVITGTLVLGLAIFVFLKYSSSVFDIVVAYLFPILVAGFGLGLMIAAIVRMTREVFKKPHIYTIVIGAVLLIIGICFAVFAQKLKGVNWILIGLVILSSSIVKVVEVASGKNLI